MTISFSRKSIGNFKCEPKTYQKLDELARAIGSSQALLVGEICDAFVLAYSQNEEKQIKAIKKGGKKAIEAAIADKIPDAHKYLSPYALASRLGINPFALAAEKRRCDRLPNSKKAFQEWSRGRDPEGIAWHFDRNLLGYIRM